MTLNYERGDVLSKRAGIPSFVVGCTDLVKLDFV